MCTLRRWLLLKVGYFINVLILLKPPYKIIRVDHTNTPYKTMV